jgi:hypothetical protein
VRAWKVPFHRSGAQNMPPSRGMYLQRSWKDSWRCARQRIGRELCVIEPCFCCVLASDCAPAKC